MTAIRSTLESAQLLVDHLDLFLEKTLPGPVLDLACGQGRRGIKKALKNSGLLVYETFTVGDGA